MNRGDIKVCHVTSVHKANDTRIFVKECCSLSKCGYSVSLVATNATNEIINGVQIIGVDAKFKNRLQRIFKLSKRVYKKALEIDADIYHLHDPELLPFCKKLKRKGKIVIFDSHEDVPKQILNKIWIPKIFRKPISSIYAIFEKKCLKNATALISVNEIIVNRLSKINKNTIQITNFPILEECTSESTKEREKAICFAGNIKEDYMHHLIIKALNQCEGVKYYLAGYYDCSYLEKLKSMDEWKHVEYLGVLNRKEVFDLYNKASIGIAVHNYTANVGGKEGGLGFIKNFEFMMSGLPIICTDFNVWEKIINENNCGICVNPHDCDGIAKAINYLINNPQEAKEMGENGKKTVREKYNWQTQENSLINLYDKLSTLE